MSDWLDNLKVGDRVIISGDSYSISTVERFTKGFIFTKGKGKFKRNGHAPGQWSTTCLVEPTPELVNRVRQVNLAYYLRCFDWKKMPLETLMAVYDLLPQKST